ncbi:SDR family oxidoreductase [Salinibacterium sp. ZJ70]|uniref:SDR family NAD(P)-dependent oxidoreductase n=1 Tax=Salinibacterium sp. ZJ70 TaxID=2708084 RepID=UPI001422E735|nr:SDR family NAD(P)-dependent oxidoreductase [Salinibacterium sp. ZJ70]
MPTALVTGGTAGIGAAFARTLAARGWDLVLVARDLERLEQNAATLRERGIQVEVMRGDLSSQVDVHRIARRLADREHPIDLLVNNAGYGMRTTLREADLAEAADAMTVMTHAPLVLSAAAMRGMVDRGHGAIVNVASVAGYVPMGLYSAIKAWLRVYSESLANELHGTGVTVTALMPGWVRTEFHERAHIRSASIPAFMWLDADKLVAACLRDVERGKAISTPSLRYRFVAWLLRHLPPALVRRIARGMSSERHRV